MAIIKCIECGRDISDRARSCPYCGCPINTQDEIVITNDNSTPVELDIKPSAQIISLYSDNVADVSVKSEEKQIAHKHSLKKKLVLIFVVVFSILLLISGIFLFFQRGKFVKRIVAEEQHVYLAIGEKTTVDYSVYPSIADYGIEYISENEDIIEVDEDGNVNAVGEGSCKLTIIAPNGEKDCVDVCVTELYSDWDFYCTLDLEDDLFGFESDFINYGISPPSIIFSEDRFELIFMGDSYSGTWNRKTNSTSDEPVFNLILDDGGSITAMIIDVNSERNLVIMITRNQTISFTN